MASSGPPNEPPATEPPAYEPRATEPSAGEPPADEGDRGTVAELIAIAKERPLLLVPAVGLLVAILLFLLEVRRFTQLGNGFGGMVVDAWYAIWTVLVIGILTVGLRTLRGRDFVRVWLFGFFGVSGLVALLGWLVTSVLDPGNLRTAYLIPLIEETVKALPLLLVVFLAATGRGREPSATDLFLLGFTIGAAFAFHENALWVRRISDGFDASLWGVLFPTFSLDIGVAGHAGWTGLVGAGIGLAWSARQRVAVWPLPVAALVVVTLDHAAANVRGTGEGFFEAITINGQAVPWLLVIGLGLAVLADWSTLKRSREHQPMADGLTIGGMRRLLAGFPAPIPARVLFGMNLLGQRRAETAGRLRRLRRRGTATEPASAG